MIFASKNYKNIECSTMQWSDWVALINADQQYCSKLKYKKPLTKIPTSSLPSWHPYYTYQVKLRKLDVVKELRQKYKSCKECPELIKVYFGIGMGVDNLKDIRKLIKIGSK